MEYVMVPVPEEHEEEVMNFLRWGARTPQIAASWAEGSIAQLFQRIDAAARSLLVTVARAALRDQELTVSELAELSKSTDREIVGTVIELNHLHQVEGAPPFILVLKELPGASPGALAWDKRAVVMADGVAPLVMAAQAVDAANSS